MRCFQCEIDSIDNLIESIDIIYKYSYNGENERNAAHGYSSVGSLCLYREVPQFFTCCTEAVSVAADRQRAHLQSGKGAAHAAAQAHDKNALGDTGRSNAVSVRRGDPRFAAQGRSGAVQRAGNHAAYRRIVRAVAVSAARAAGSVPREGPGDPVPHQLLGQSGCDKQGRRQHLRYRSGRHKDRRGQLRISAGHLGRAGNRRTEHTAFPCLSKPAGPADSAPARTVPAARGQLGHQAGNTVFPSKSRSVA